MKPAVPFARAADQMRLRLLTLEKSQIPPPGRVMFRRGRRIIGHGDVAKLGDRRAIPDEADTVCVSVTDFPDVKEWLDGRSADL